MVEMMDVIVIVVLGIRIAMTKRLQFLDVQKEYHAYTTDYVTYHTFLVYGLAQQNGMTQKMDVIVIVVPMIRIVILIQIFLLQLAVRVQI